MFFWTDEPSSRDGVVSTRRNRLFLLWLLFTSIDCSTEGQSTGGSIVQGEGKSIIMDKSSWYKPNLFQESQEKLLREDKDTNEMDEFVYHQNNPNVIRDKRSDSTELQPNRVSRNDGPLNKNFLRFGRAKLDRNFLRFGRRSGLPGNFLRYGRLNGLSKNFLRFGRTPQLMGDLDHLPILGETLEIENCKDCSLEANFVTRQPDDGIYQMKGTWDNDIDRNTEELVRFRRYQKPNNQNNANGGKRGSSKLGRNFVRFGKRSKFSNFSSEIQNENQ